MSLKPANYITQKRILESFNHYVDDLISKIRLINEVNEDPEMIAIKTKRLIEKWFRNTGKL